MSSLYCPACPHFLSMIHPFAFCCFGCLICPSLSSILYLHSSVDLFSVTLPPAHTISPHFSAMTGPFQHHHFSPEDGHYIFFSKIILSTYKSLLWHIPKEMLTNGHLIYIFHDEFTCVLHIKVFVFNRLTIWWTFVVFIKSVLRKFIVPIYVFMYSLLSCPLFLVFLSEFEESLLAVDHFFMIINVRFADSTTGLHLVQ